MAFFFTVGLLLAAYLLGQAAKIFMTGDLRAFFAKPLRAQRPRLPPRDRIVPVLLHLVIGVAVLVSLVAVAASRSASAARRLFPSHVASALGGIFLAVYGLSAAARPDLVVRQLARAYPGQLLEGDATLERIVRLVSVGVSAFGFYLLAKL